MTKVSKFLNVGVGGVKCTCCFPAPRSKARKAEFRRAKRVSEREARRLIAESV